MIQRKDRATRRRSIDDCLLAASAQGYMFDSAPSARALALDAGE
jgi:hypothetical protein